MTPFAIAGVQMRVSATESNLENMRRQLALLTHLYPWVQMVVFSELATYGPTAPAAKAESLPGATEKAFCELAARHRLWLLPGSIYERSGGHIYNTASVIDPTGKVIGRYRKMFPFQPYETGVTPGDQFLVFDVPEAGRFGVSICYDMWFPETTRTLAAMGAEVILHPSLTGTIDRDAELAIARASAVINQCYFFDINGLGDGGNGRSIIIGPDGIVRHQAGASEEIMPLEIDFDRVRRGRRHGLLRLGQVLKSFRDRKIDFAIYDKNAELPYLESLGPLEKPTRATMAGEQ